MFCPSRISWARRVPSSLPGEREAMGTAAQSPVLSLSSVLAVSKTRRSSSNPAHTRASPRKAGEARPGSTGHKTRKLNVEVSPHRAGN